MELYKPYDCQLAWLTAGKELFIITDRPLIQQCCLATGYKIAVGDTKGCCCGNQIKRVDEEGFLDFAYCVLRERLARGYIFPKPKEEEARK
jgi:hypothetical protein